MTQFNLNRRGLLGAAATQASWLWLSRAWAQSDPLSGPAPPLTQISRDPLLVNTLYRWGPGSNYDPITGAGEFNRKGFTGIEYQRGGAEWIVHGYAMSRPDWIAIGWKQLDYGLSNQNPDGGFSGDQPYFGTGFFVEALARSMIFDPKGRTNRRTSGLGAACDWLLRNEQTPNGAPASAELTHRRYVFAAALGQAGTVLGRVPLLTRANEWAEEGVGRQLTNGVNPEKSGFDVSYQMVGIMFAMRFLCVCNDPSVRRDLRLMTRRAIQWDLGNLLLTGEVSMAGSTRIGRENLPHSDQLKGVDYTSFLQALVFARYELPDPELMQPAQLIAKHISGK